MLKTATSKEDYLNLDTLESRLMQESRLLNCIRRPSINNHNQQYPQDVSSSLVGTMIPTPGMLYVVNSNVAATSSVDASMIITPGCNSMASPSVNSGSMFPTSGLHGNSISGSDSNYKCCNSSPSLLLHFFFKIFIHHRIYLLQVCLMVISHCHPAFQLVLGNHAIMGAQRIASQMIPTPGFTGSNNSYMNAESSDNSGVFSSVESSMVSQPQQQKQLVGGQNNNVMQNLGSQMGGGMRNCIAGALL